MNKIVIKRTTSLALLSAALLSAVVGCGKTYDFDPLTVGDDGAARVRKPRSNSQFIRAVYADLADRAPAVYDFEVDYAGSPPNKFPVDEQAILLAAFDGIGDPDPLRAVLVAGLVDSVEVKIPKKEEVSNPSAFITDQFHRFLGREPTAYELFAFKDAWTNDPAVEPKTIVRAILGSREYQSQ